jgi:hypothetical protein
LCVQDLGYDQPTVLLSNDSQAAVKLITRYAQRMLVEKAISDAARFFHLPLSIFPFPTGQVWRAVQSVFLPPSPRSCGASSSMTESCWQISAAVVALRSFLKAAVP